MSDLRPRVATTAYPDNGHNVSGVSVFAIGPEVHLRVGGNVHTPRDPPPPESPHFSASATLSATEARTIADSLLSAATRAEQHQEPNDDEAMP